MAFQLISNTLLQASLPSAQPLHASIVPLTVFDRAALNLHVGAICGFTPPTPSNEVLKSALSTTLVHFPHLTGRFTRNEQGYPCIALNNAGMRVTETYLPTPLSDYLPVDPSTDVSHLFPPLEEPDVLFQVQLNRYKCGGLVIGYSSHHRVADGQSMSSFMVAWTRMVRGLDIIPLPCHDRGAVFFPRDQLKVEFDHGMIEFQQNLNETLSFTSSFEKFITYFSIDFINKIKEKIVHEDTKNTNQRYSTFECLLAHLWKKVTLARGLKPEEFTQIRVPVNGRARLTPKVPQEYFGNLVLFAFPRLTVKEVLHESHAYVAEAIHDAIAAIDNMYFQSFIDFGELSETSGEKLESSVPDLGNIISPDLEADSWLRFKFHDLDFGGGPCVFCFPNIPVEGVLVFLPSLRAGGGVDVVMSLLPEHAHCFRQCCQSLD